MVNREDLLSGTRPEVGERILVTEKEGFQGYEITEYKGMVWGISIRAKDIAQNLYMGIKKIVGGELTSFTELSDESRQKALDRLLESARRIGANAVINFHFQLSSAFPLNKEVVAYGNAVVIKPIKNYVPLGGLGNILAEILDTYTGKKYQESLYPSVDFNEDATDEDIIEYENSNNTKNKEDKELPFGELIENSGFKFVRCPECGVKYNAEIDENGCFCIKEMPDTDAIEPGKQIYCLKCGTKFTLPEVE